MLKSVCLILYVLQAIALWSNSNDSIRYYRLKGIDVTFGGVSNKFGENAYINLLKATTPEQVRSKFIYDDAISNKETIDPVRIGLAIVFGNNRVNSRYFIKKHEVMFKFTFETMQTENTFENIKFAVNPVFVNSASLKFTYQTQTIGLGYQISTRSFLRNLALFGGISADFGMVLFKRIEGPIYTNVYSVSDDLTNYYTTIVRGNTILGLKYNLSCDINFFLQGEFGMLHYGNDIGTNATYLGASIGMRYKFLEDQDKLKYKQDVFW